MATTAHSEAPGSSVHVGDLRSQFGALLSGCGVYELGERAKVKVTGNDRVRWLNSMVSNNIRDLAGGHGLFAFLLSPQGHILGDLYVFKREDCLFLDIDQAQLTKEHAILKRYIIMDKVELTDVSREVTAMGLAGRTSRAVLNQAGIPIPELEPLEFCDLTWQETPLTLVRGPQEHGESYEIWLSPGEVNRLRDALHLHGAVFVGNTALDLRRITWGIPRYGQDIRERDLPHETGEMRALNFTKGCYIGQEIVERIRSRGSVHRRFTGFVIDGALPPAGTKIQAEAKEVGEITSVASLPFENGELRVALGYIRREAEGKALIAGEAKITVAGLPFEQRA